VERTVIFGDARMSFCKFGRTLSPLSGAEILPRGSGSSRDLLAICFGEAHGSAVLVEV
jgi:hypothetical protein